MSGRTYHGPLNPDRTPKNGESRIIIYGYVPSTALAAVGVATFALIFLANTFYAIRRKGYRSFHLLLTVGAVSFCRELKV